MKRASRKALVGAIGVAALGLWSYDVFSHVRNQILEARWEAQQEIERHTQVDGQIFTVGKDGESVRLGDVRVALYQGSEFDNSMVKAISEAQEELTTTENLVDACNRGNAKILGALTGDLADAERRADLDALRLSTETKADAVANRNELIAQIAEAASMPLRPIRMVTTDADGRFRMEVDKSILGPAFYLFANAHRGMIKTGFPLVWVLNSWQVSSPLILSDSDVMSEFELKHFQPSTVVAIPRHPKTPESFWWLAHLVALGLIIGAGGLGLSWARRKPMVREEEPPPFPNPPKSPMQEKRRPAYQLPSALIVGLVILAMSYYRMDTHNLGYEQHPIASILGTATPAFLGGLIAFWLAGRGQKKPK